MERSKTFIQIGDELINVATLSRVLVDRRNKDGEDVTRLMLFPTGEFHKAITVTDPAEVERILAILQSLVIESADDARE